MTQVYEQKVTEGFDNFGSLQDCNSRQPPPPPPPKIVAVHPKKKPEENDAKMEALKETEKKSRSNQRSTATPRTDKAKLVKNLPTSVRKAFAAKNRLVIPSHNSTPLQPLTKKKSLSIETTSIRSGESGSSIYRRPSFGFRKDHSHHTSQSSKTKKNFADLFRRVAKAVRRVSPSEQDSFAGETLI